MTLQLTRSALAGLVLTVTTVTPAHAIFGIGDVSHDPAAYSQLTAIYNTLVEQYQAVREQLVKAEEISDTLKRAHAGYERLKNYDLDAAVKRGTPNGDRVSNAGMLDKAGVIRREMDRMVGTGRSERSYLETQANHVGALERLELMHKASTKNVTDAAVGLNPAEAQAVTAQSTAALAALATEAAGERTARNMATERAAKMQADHMNSSSQMLDALKKSPGAQ
jgi:hypothetical protein